MKIPLVSVIIPVYNVENFLRKCLNAVFTQTFKNWECIVIDDGSTDNSGKICDEYANKDDRIKVLRIENSGPAIARNCGLDIAKGEYIYFLDSDDFIEPNTFEKVITEMDKGYDMVSFNYIREDSDGNIIRHSNFPIGQYKFLSIEDRFDFLCLKFLHYNYGWEGWNRFFRNEIIKKYHLRYCPQSKIGEDMLFCVMYLTHSESYKILEDETYHYIKRTGTLLDNSKHKDNLDSYLKMFHTLKLHIDENFPTSIAKKYYAALLILFLQIEICNLRMKKFSYKEISERIHTISDSETRLILHSFITNKKNINIIGKKYYFRYCYDAFISVARRSHIELLLAKIYYRGYSLITLFLYK